VFAAECFAPVAVGVGYAEVAAALAAGFDVAVEFGGVHLVGPFLFDDGEGVGEELGGVEAAVGEEFACFGENKLDLFCFGFDDEVYDFFYFCDFVVVDVLSELESLAAVGDLEATAHYVSWVVEAQFQIV
jgi:hypothetical protein